jgi:hypothetical protein
VTAEQKEYKVEKFDENLTIQPKNIRYVTFNLDDGEEFEIIYSVQVNISLPIDIWLVTEDNYLLFVSNAQFLYYIDGSEREVIYTKKIVTIEEHGVYVLVMAYYNNQTVEVNIIGELRTYLVEISETSSWQPSDFFYPLLLAVTILVILLIVFYSKARKYKRTMIKGSHKVSSKKKAKRHKEKKIKDQVANAEPTMRTKKHKVKKVKPKVSEEESYIMSEVPEPKQTEPEVSDKAIPGYCGYCGEPVDTPYCKSCGRKVSNS